ncbi:hypothetical protein D910_04424, partial [Dendroctonus ponderosae]
MELRYGWAVNKGVISLMAVGLLMVCTSTLMFVHHPLPTIVKMLFNFSEGSIFFNIWSAPPIDVFLKIYMFNVTNPKEFLSGKEKMNVSEIGPYVYREVLTNQNATFNDTDGTVTYQPHREIIFAPEKSVGDPKVDRVLTTNIALVGIQAYFKDLGFFASLGFSAAARSFGAEPIINITIDEYLWGYNDPLITYAHSILPFWIDFDKFGIFATMISRDNGNTLTMVRDPSKYHSQTESLLTEEERNSEYHLVKWNNLAGLTDWGYQRLPNKSLKKCQLIEGAFDGTILPKNLRANRSLTVFRKAFCRPVTLQFVRDTVGKQGLQQYEYKFDDNMFGVGETNECFCYKNKCVKGFQSIAPCYYGMPITLSQPHYLNADEAILKTVNGMNPNVEQHGSSCIIQPLVGAPLSGNMKIQVNIDVGQTIGNHKTVPFNNMQVPLFWVEITTAEMPTLMIITLHMLCNALPIILEIIKYLLGLGGLAMISGSALYILLKTPVRIPGRISFSNSEYVPFPIISIPSDLLDKCEKR